MAKPQNVQSNRLIEVGPFRLDSRRRILFNDERRFQLTPMECKLLRFFMEHEGQVLSHRFLMKEVWHTDYVGDIRTLYVHVHKLREKLEQDPSHPLHLIAIRGVGYRFVCEGR
jgi:two-component system response regulator RegX3